MNLTKEQQAVVDYLQEPATDDLVLVEAVAGSGKTTLLVAIAKAIPHKNSIYLAYNKAIATSSQTKFPETTHCMTTHSMAYQATVKPYKLQLGLFNYRAITEKLKYELKCRLVELVREFCLSKHLTYKEFSVSLNEDDSKLTKLATVYLNRMQTGEIECTHEFYLKLFHVYLASGEIQYDPFDFIMLDEAGDLNEVTLAIFRLLPATKKIAVGDPHQNIYSFNHTINCFKALEDEGTTFTLPQSFRVPQAIASRIDRFCKKNLNKDMKFVGVPVDDSTIKTRGYITRTNSALIGKMIELNAEKVPYGLVRKVTEIFRMPMLLANMKYQGFISDPHYKHIQTDFDDWHEDASIQKKYRSPFSYIAELYTEDMQLSLAANIINRYGKKVIFDTYYEAKRHENSKQAFLLVTAHSSKGLEFDEVIIADDLNDSIVDILNRLELNPGLVGNLDLQDTEALNLYYVATTRCLKRLNNATHL